MHWAERIERRVKLRDLHILTAVAQSGSMGKAAAGLAVSQPAVSKAIADLEYALGVRLLDRSRQGVEPTVYGRALLKWGVAAFDALRQGVKELEFLADPAGGELRVGCTEPLAAAFVPAVVDHLCRRHPRAVFDVVPANRVALLDRELRQRRVDLIVTPTEGLNPGKDADVMPLFDDVHIVMAGAHSKWARRRNVALDELAKESWVLPPPDSLAGISIARAFRASGVEPPRAQIASFSVPLLCHLLATGRYLTMCPVSLLHLARHMPLKALPVPSLRDHRPIGIFTLRNRTLSPLAQIFIQQARATAESLRGARRAAGGAP